MPLRTQLILLLMGAVALVVLVSSLAGTAALRSYLVDRIDDQLRSSLEQPPPGPGGPGDRDRRGRRFDVAVTTLQYDESGRITPRSAARLAALGGPRVEDPRRHFRDPDVVDDVQADRRWRVLADSEGAGVVLVAVALDGVEDTVSQLLVINGAVGLIALSGGGALAWSAVRRSLRPLVAVEATAQAIAAGDLSVRVPPADPRTEIGSLAASFNVMVDRFESAFTAQQQSEGQARASESRMRQFVADASHELRTPLTSIRGFAELFRQGAASDPEQLAQVMRRIEDEAARMGLLVEDLLLLARLDQQRPLRQDPVDLLAVAGEVVSAAAAVHGAHHQVRLHPPVGDEPPVVRGDEARLHQVLSNLVGNAAAHTAAGTAVDVRLRTEGAVVRVEVCDDGAGMRPEVAARVFERFYRADAARTRSGSTTTGSGLGLSIVAALVAAHGGTVEVQTAPGEGSCFTVRLPRDSARG
ncbi:MAG: integral rane sensor signal transduction histidine kinase [Frankiales bacterium]|nr:integral rane sensor signal transduction histidine kinase [Frankiales bacterium]